MNVIFNVKKRFYIVNIYMKTVIKTVNILIMIFLGGPSDPE